MQDALSASAKTISEIEALGGGTGSGGGGGNVSAQKAIEADSRAKGDCATEDYQNNATSSNEQQSTTTTTTTSQENAAAKNGRYLPQMLSKM